MRLENPYHATILQKRKVLRTDGYVAHRTPNLISSRRTQYVQNCGV